MIIDLIGKDFTYFKEEKKKQSIWNRILKILLFCCGIAFLVFFSDMVIVKVNQYAPSSKVEFLTLFLFIDFIIEIISGLVRARKVMYDKKDYVILASLSLSIDSIVFSKMVYVFIYQVLEFLFVSTPILITYCALNQLHPYFYVFSCIYPLLISLFSIGVIFIILSLVQLIYKLIKDKEIVQFILASLIVIGLSFVYQYILNIFLKALSDNTLSDMFPTSFILALGRVTTYLFPVSSLTFSIFKGINILPYVLLFLGGTLFFFVAGYLISTQTYESLNRTDMSDYKINKEKQYKVMSPIRGLIKKEFMLLFRSSGQTFSYSALLIMLPFLTFTVLSSINTVLNSNLTILLTYFPNILVYIQYLILIEFVLVIHSNTSSLYLEKNNLANVKLSPIDPKTIMLTKILIPLSLTSFSYLVTLIVSYATKNISASIFWFSLITGLCILVALNFGGILFDMKDRTNKSIKFLPLFKGFILIYPIILTIFNALMESNHFGLIPALWIDLAITVTLLATILILFFKKSNIYYKDMEVTSV